MLLVFFSFGTLKIIERMLIRLNFDYSQGFVEERILFGFRLVAIPSFFF